MQTCSAQTKGGLPDGHGKVFLTKGRVFIGEFKYRRMSKGKLYQIEDDKTFTVYQVRYDCVKDKNTGKDQ